MILILVRHANTSANSKNLFSGHTNHRLNAKGLEQARRLGERLKSEIIHGAYSSDLTRARKTALAALKHHPGIKLSIMRDLRESSLGKLEGKPKKLYRHLTSRQLSMKYGVESDSAVMKRVKKTLALLYKRHKDDTVLVVAHGWFNRLATLALTGKHIKDVQKVKTMPHASFSIFEIGPKRSKAILLNSSEHLRDEGNDALTKYLKKKPRK